MKNVDMLRTQKPRLWRLACEMVRIEIPFEAFKRLVILSSPALKGGNGHDQQ